MGAARCLCCVSYSTFRRPPSPPAAIISFKQINPGGAHISDSPKFFISAGEASGEHYGTLLIDALRSQLASSGQTGRFFGMGGERMAAAGCECIVRSEDVAVMGITEVLRHLPRIYGEFRRLKQSIRERRPDVAVLIDFPDFHLRLAREFHRLGIPVVFFVSPQLWAWKKHRIKQVQRHVDRMLVIFPFEEAFYRKHGIPAEFVGHPLADETLPTLSRKEFSAAYNIDPTQSWIGLLPGSRIKEIRSNLPEMLAAARKLAAHHAEALTFLLPLATMLTHAQREEVRRLVKIHGSGIGERGVEETGTQGTGAGGPGAGGISLDIHLVEDARATLFHARASIVASGTATVEAALMGNPFVVVYRVSALTYAIAKCVVKVPHIAMVNLIANKRVVPELIQSEFTAEKIVQHLLPLLVDGKERMAMMDELAGIRGMLRTTRTSSLDAPFGTTPKHPTAIDRVAAIALEVLARIS